MMGPSALPKPNAQGQIHRSKTLTMRHPLHQQTPRGNESIQQTVNAPQIGNTETAQLAMHKHISLIIYFRFSVAIHPWTPDMHFIAGRRQSLRNQLRIIADATSLWWVLAGNQMPSHRSLMFWSD